MLSNDYKIQISIRKTRAGKLSKIGQTSKPNNKTKVEAEVAVVTAAIDAVGEFSSINWDGGGGGGGAVGSGDG